MKNNKIKIILISIVFIILGSSICWADDKIEENNEKEIDEILQTAVNVNQEPVINSRAAIIYDRKTGRVLWGKNENEKRKMASTTKIMTAIVVLENENLNDTIEVSGKAAGTGGSRLGLKKGDKITINDLLYGLMLCSGNDAAVALAEYTGGSIEGFAVMMNEKAKELGLEQTNFVTPHGLDENEHYTTAKELAVITDYALKNEKICNIVGTKSYTVTINGYGKTISNTNELLGYLEGVYGVKTGFTNGANRCLVTATKRDNMDIICVVLGADTKKDRTKDSINIIEYAFKNYKMIDISETIQEELESWENINKGRINIEKGDYECINLKFDKYDVKEYIIKNDGSESITIEIECEYDFVAPIESNKIIGNYKVKLEDEIIEEGNIYIENGIPKKDIRYYIKDIIKNYNSYISTVILDKNF